MMGDFVAGGFDGRDEMGIFFRTLTDYKKSSLGAMVGEEREDLRGIIGIGSVVDRQPDLPLFGFESSDNRSEALCGWRDDIPSDDGIDREEEGEGGGLIPWPKEQGQQFTTQKQQGK